MTNFNWGIIGPGQIANRFAGALAADFVGNLYAVGCRSKQRGEAFSQKYGGQKVYTNYQDLINDKQVDAVYIATPHNFHFELVKSCLKAKKPVLCEKPLTVTAAQTAELIELAKANNTFLMEAMWSLYLPVYQQANKWIAEGKIGDIELIRSTFGFNIPKDDPEDRNLNPNLAGGALLDRGVYCVATAQWFMQEKAQNIQAMGTIGETGVDLTSMANLAYSNNKFAQFNTNLVCKTENNLHIYGSKGRIEISSMFWESEEITLYTNEDNSKQTLKLPFSVNGFEYEIAEAEKCIKAGKIQSDVVTHEFTLNSMQTMDEILRQLRS
ncbi:Gfo/Idh/MocA family protein [Catenovulum agarivorans]|uniref:Gfo/Idh/MocA family protein n=1 Tax=Catenovulum agarivorans TaxID=1172192 RepID=UPI0002D9A7AE|nr:Gfo/Idh/MocA family oxidoreductase [Catenovulum agarivorans]